MRELEVGSVPETIERLRALGILPVVELADVGQAEPLFEALSAGGLPAVEVTLRSAAGLEAIAVLRKAYPDGFVGAGTVRTVEDAARVLDAGAQFVASPATDPELVRFVCDNQVLVMPGVCTPTEIQMALGAGAPLLKFFPAEAAGGVPFLKAVAGPFRAAGFVPTGGISAANLGDYLRLAQVVACGGSWMVAPSLLDRGDFAGVESLAAEAVRIVAEARR